MIPADFASSLSHMERIARNVRREKALTFVGGVLAGMALMTFLVMWLEAGAP